MRRVLALSVWGLVASAMVLVSARAVLDPHSIEEPPEEPELVSPEQHRALEALGYADTFPVEDPAAPAIGVTVWDRTRAQPGLNLYNPRNKRWAELVDMSGEAVHRWQPTDLGGPTWQHTELLPGGDLLVIQKDHALTRIDWSSEVIWTVPMRFHHDLDVAPDGTIWALARRDAIVVVVDVEIPLLNDLVVRISPDGQVLEIIDLWPALSRFVKPRRFERLLAWSENEGMVERLRQGDPSTALLDASMLADLTHVNTIELLARDVEGVGSRGDLLLAPRSLDRVAVIGNANREVLWTWRTGLQRPHHPTLVSGDRIMVFDNGTRRKRSRVVEIDPLNREIVWQYGGTDQPTLYTQTRGGSQRLPNGNTLITESNRGRVIEVTSDGEIVWEFFCPHLVRGARDGSRRRPAIYRMVRITDQAIYGLDRLLR